MKLADNNHVGDNIVAGNANWTFSGAVADSFDQHVQKSVPFYSEGHKLVCRLSDFFVFNDSIVYDLGCSTGELTIKLAEHNKAKQGACFIGVDHENDMINVAKEKLSVNDSEKAKVEFVVDDVLQHQFEPADLIVANYTIQFIRPSEKQRMIDKVFSALKWGGAFVMFEKVRACDARFQDMMTSLYTDYKLEQGYTADEIVAKSRSLKGVLEPFSSNGNLDLLRRAGFVDVLSVFKYVCFEGFLAIK